MHLINRYPIVSNVNFIIDTIRVEAHAVYNHAMNVCMKLRLSWLTINGE